MRHRPRWMWPAAFGTLIAGALFFWQPLVSPADAPTIAVVPSTAYSGAYVTNGGVNAIVRSGGNTYIGGGFTAIGPRTGHGVPISATSGAPTSGFPDVAGGDVLAAVSDGSGGWVIGGEFTQVGGVSRNRVARFNADGSLNTSWDLNVNGAVRTIVIADIGPGAAVDEVVFIGGDFTTVKGGTTRNRVAMFDLDDGSLRTWNPNVTGTSVNTIYVDGTDVTIGGDFTQILGTARSHIGVVNTTEPTPSLGVWNPIANDPVNALAVYSSSNLLFVGGEFSNIGGSARARFAVFNTTTGALLPPAPVFNGDINAFHLSGTGGSTLYTGGAFTVVGGVARNRLIAFNAATGTALGWDPDVDNTVHALSASADGNTVYAGGDFRTVNGASVDRNSIAALDSTSGTATSWDPSASHSVKAIAASGSDVFAGGTFASIGAQDRNRLAALDSNGQLTSWNPDADGTVNALVASSDGNTIYAGGDFTTVNSESRNRIAALSSSNGTATLWNPDANGTVRALEVSGTSVFAGGDFTTIGGATRGRFSALDASGDALGANPDINNSVHALEVASGFIAVGGAFTLIGATVRNGLAAFDLDNGSLQTWNPDANATVRSLAASSTTIFAGGNFTTIGGQARNRLVAIDPSSGAPIGVDPLVNGSVRALAVGNTSLYIGGNFTSIGGQARNYLAESDLDATSVLSWDPNGNGQVNALALSDSSVFAGGTFTMVGTQSNSGFAQFTSAPTNNTAPTISGSTLVGSTLTCSQGSWDDGYATLVYQWLRGGSAISGATSTTYVSTDTDVGAAITCQVTATNVGGATSAASSAVTVEAAPSPSPPSAPVDTSPSTGSSDEFKITNESVSPRCLRSKSSKSTSRKKSKKSKSASKARKSSKSSRKSKRAKSKKKVGSKLKIGFNLSEKAEVTISIRKRKGSNRTFRRCPSKKKKKGKAAERPGKYEEVQKITESVGAGANSASLSLPSKSSKKKRRVKNKHIAKSSTPKAFEYSLEAPDMSKGQDGSAPASKKQPAQNKAVKKKAVKKKRAGKARIRHRKSKGNRSLARTSFSRSAGAGDNAVDVSGSSSLKNLKPGTYKAYITAINAAGVESTTKAVKFWVLRR